MMSKKAIRITCLILAGIMVLTIGVGAVALFR